MVIKALAAGAAALTLTAGAAHAINLAGQTVTVDLTAGGFDFGAQNVLVGNGYDGNYFGDTYFDLNGGPNTDEFIVYSTSDFCGIVCDGLPVIWTLSNLNFGVPLTSFTVLQTISPITINYITPTSIQFTYADVAIPQGVYEVGQFNGSVVPEPSAWALMLLGFGGLGSAMRSRRKAALAG
jgi:hypothetical protein